VDLINGIAPIYATDPAYAGHLQRILSMDEVQAALLLARQ
jgi:flagellum-specific peptidoglycan hydrolase FlgJ